MKRVAESQLTKDSVEGEDDSQEPSTGIQKADPSALSARKIRGLPKRSLAAAAPPGTSTTPIGSSNGTTEKLPEPASRFSGFTGFGGSATSAFTFTPPVSQANTTPPQITQTSSTPVGKSLHSAPVAQPSKVFSFVPPSNPTPPSTPPSTSDSQAKRDVAHKYCLSLRGLNTSFLDAITRAVQADPFVDITEMLEKYKSIRSSALKEFDDNFSTLGSNQTTTGLPPMAPLSSKNPLSMPTPPKSFFGFGKDRPADASSQQHATGFTPKLDHSQEELPSSSSTWPSKTGTSDKPVLFGASQPVTFGNEKSSPGSTLSSGKPSAELATPFGSSALVSTSPVRGDTGSVKPNITATPDKAFEGHDASQGKAIASSFNFKPSAPTGPLTPGFSSFLGPSKLSHNLGDTSTPHLTKSSTSNPSPPSPSGFGFGKGKNSSVSNPFSFGKGSIGNPVGFAFGSPPTIPSDVKPTDTSNSSPEPVLKVGSEADDAALLSPSQDPSPAPSQGSAYDADGPGEEDEVTLHETKAHAYKLASTGRGWVSVGKGQLKLKGRVDLKRRILMRNSSTGQIILNFNLFTGFTTKVDVSQKVISFRVPGEDETATVYQLRVPNEAEAVNWQKTVQKEVDGLLRSDET